MPGVEQRYLLDPCEEYPDLGSVDTGGRDQRRYSLAPSVDWPVLKLLDDVLMSSTTEPP
jgi:hypothetical protein